MILLTQVDNRGSNFTPTLYTKLRTRIDKGRTQVRAVRTYAWQVVKVAALSACLIVKIR